jgi:hypothetical protein
VEDEKRPSIHRSLEELICEQVLIIVVDSTVNVATLVLILKPAVDHNLLVAVGAVLAIQDVDECLSSDARNGIGGVFQEEMGEDGLLSLLYIHNRLKRGGCGLLSL